ncbi:hypothetical protein os4_36740 (plasmid) [Comamonadaceae bacterium OS-4]|nr:hypothetical protein os4_36740 [Comamonadaceae bacterium OS-4]
MASSLQRRYLQSQLKSSECGTVPGIYLKPERRSGIQFGFTFLSQSCLYEAAVVLEKSLDALYARHGEKKVEWYIERSLGLDVHRNIAWSNVDITDLVVG